MPTTLMLAPHTPPRIWKDIYMTNLEVCASNFIDGGIHDPSILQVLIWLSQPEGQIMPLPAPRFSDLDTALYVVRNSCSLQ